MEYHDMLSLSPLARVSQLQERERASTSNQSEPRPVARRQGRYWIITIPFAAWCVPSECPELLAYVHGQQELGANVGDQGESYHHWQLYCITKKKASAMQVKSCFANEAHVELTRSEAAEEYCLKDATCIDGTRFELGQRPIRRNAPVDWERVWELAKSGDLLGIPANIRVQNYRTLCQIRSDFAAPVAIERMVSVYWGRSGTGKSRRAWMEAGNHAYCKDPRSKFWYGYRDQSMVIIDEFRGGIDIAHLLRWLDRYPCNVELKGSSCPLSAEKIWITSNKSPAEWYPELDAATLEALMRRFHEVVHFE